MSQVEQLITENLDIWLGAVEKGRGAGSTNKSVKFYGIKLLRRMILGLAVQGNLTAQKYEDRSAKAALEHEDIVSRTTSSGKGIKVDFNKPISEEEKSFQIPRNWEWTRLGKIVEVTGGSQPPKSVFVSEPREGYTRLIQIRDFKSDNFPVYVPNKNANRPFNETDIMIGRYGPPVFQILKGKSGTYNVALMKADPVGLALTKDYLFYLLSEPGIQDLVVSESERTAGQSGVRKELIYNFPVALPPVEEQARIVEKINELMALCDQLEQQTESSLNAHQTLVETLLKALLDAAQSRDDASAFEQAWQRIADHFDVLFTTEHSIDQLKQTILQLAVMGKLAPQDPNDEPASVLLEKIAAEKERLVKEGKIKKQKKLPPISDEEKPFELPEGWEWCRVGEISQLISGKGFKKSEYSESGARLFQIANVSLGHTKWDVKNFMPMNCLQEFPELKLFAGDVLIALNRPLLNRKMKVCILSEEDLPAVLYQRVGKFIFFSSSIDTEYFYYFLQSYLFIDHLDSNLQGSDQPFINQSQLVTFQVPLPPVIQQKQIVNKLKELLAVCDSLRVGIQESQTTQLHLADAMAEQALA